MRDRATNDNGFTLVELMMVVAVIALLAMITLPSVRDRLVRQQVQEALSLADFAQQAIGSRYTATGKLPADNAAAGLPPPERIVSKFISSATVRDGALVLTFGTQVSSLIAGKTVSVRPATVNGYPMVPITWLCGKAAVPPNMTVHGPDDTTLPAALLPLKCRKGGPP